ncbi:MAG: hypothetical protein NUV77_08270 [Thermoguttaceae bacterium]|nr:hypothetical protein [Thermoguttaceae bacterium]
MRFWCHLLTLGFCVAALVAWWSPRAQADKAFFDEFVAKYVKADSENAKDRAFKEAVDKVKCNVCHEGKAKKNRNVYGRALAKFLSRKTDKEDKPKIQASLDKVAAMKVDPADEKSPTFGDLIKQGKLPAGDGQQDASP